LTLVAAIAPTIMITTVALERSATCSGRHARPAASRAARGPHNMQIDQGRTGSPDRGRGDPSVPAGRRNSTYGPPAKTTISAELVTNPAGWEKSGVGHVLAVKAGACMGTAMIAAQAGDDVEFVALLTNVGLRHSCDVVAGVVDRLGRVWSG
jgi:hypothetical protein